MRYRTKSILHEIQYLISGTERPPSGGTDLTTRRRLGGLGAMLGNLPWTVKLWSTSGSHKIIIYHCAPEVERCHWGLPPMGPPYTLRRLKFGPLGGLRLWPVTETQRCGWPQPNQDQSACRCCPNTTSALISSKVADQVWTDRRHYMVARSIHQPATASKNIH